jgi:hypothetical protein
MTFHPEDMIVPGRAFSPGLLLSDRGAGRKAGRAAVERQMTKLIDEIAQARERSPDRVAELALERSRRA